MITIYFTVISWQWNFIVCDKLLPFHSINRDFNSGSKLQIHVSSIATICFRNPSPSFWYLLSSCITTSFYCARWSSFREWETHSMQIFLFCIASFIMQCADVFDKFVSCAVFSNVNRWSSSIIVVPIVVFVDSVDVHGHPRYGSSTDSWPPLNFADYIKSVKQFKALAPHTSHNKL